MTPFRLHNQAVYDQLSDADRRELDEGERSPIAGHPENEDAPDDYDPEEVRAWQMQRR